MELTPRNILAFIAANILILSGKVRRARIQAQQGKYILSVYFHAPSKKLFESCIKWLQRKGFHFISVPELEEIYRGKKAFPKGAVLITVDDGWLSNEDNIVAVADRYNIPVSLFISTAPVRSGYFWWTYADIAYKNQLLPYTKEQLKKLSNVERVKILEPLLQLIKTERQAMTIGQLIRIAASKNVTVGGHTVTHPILSNCSDEESFNEIKNSKQDLQNWLTTEINSFSYPNGDYTSREINYLQELDFKLGFCTEEAYLTQDKLQSNYQIPRFYINERASLAENICRMTGVWPGKKAIS